MSFIDAYGHVALPRFMSADEFVRLMDQNQVERAVVTTAETCPDLAELVRAALQHGDRLRPVGLAMGDSPGEIRDGVAAQMDAGFAGVRLSDNLAAEQPELLEVIGKAGGAAYVVGSEGLRVAATVLCEFLDRYPESLVCAPHFAGVADPGLFERDLSVRFLFRHPRFLVIFSRQGALSPGPLRAWVDALLHNTGWDRVLWGSEYPVSLWRDETYASTASWADSAGLFPGPAQRSAFLCDNARRHLFSKPPRPAGRLATKWSRVDLKREAPVWLSPRATLELPEDVHRRFFTAYQEWGGEGRGRYSAFLADVLSRALLPVEETPVPETSRRRTVSGTPHRRKSAVAAGGD